MFFPDADAVVEWIIKNQFGRRNLSLHDRSKLALRLEDVYKERAKANQAEAGGDKKSLHQISDKAIAPVNTLKEVAKIAGVGRDTVAHRLNFKPISLDGSYGRKQQKSPLFRGFS